MVNDPAQGHWCSRRQPKAIARSGPGTVGTDPSLLRHYQSVGYRDSPGNSAGLVTRSIGSSRMPLWSALVVSLYYCTSCCIELTFSAWTATRLSLRRRERCQLFRVSPSVNIVASSSIQLL